MNVGATSGPLSERLLLPANSWGFLGFCRQKLALYQQSRVSHLIHTAESGITPQLVQSFAGHLLSVVISSHSLSSYEFVLFQSFNIF